MATKDISLSIDLDLEAKSCIRRQAGGDEKHLILIGVQTKATDQVTAMVVARIEQKPERLCAGDEFEESALWSKRASELKDITKISNLNLHTPLSEW